MSEEKLQPPNIRMVTPDHLGWLKIRDRVWELPDGRLHIFPPHEPEVLMLCDMPEVQP